MNSSSNNQRTLWHRLGLTIFYCVLTLVLGLPEAFCKSTGRFVKWHI